MAIVDRVALGEKEVQVSGTGDELDVHAVAWSLQIGCNGELPLYDS